LPIEVNDPDFPIVQYADDTLLIIPADLAQIVALKDVLHNFTLSTGLKINYHKSSMVPINVPVEDMKVLAEAFGCQIASLPFTYLGLPLGTTKPKLNDLAPIVTRLERRLTSVSSFLSQGARLQLVDSALSSMSTFFLCSLDLPPGITKQLDRILRQCLWRDNIDTPKQSLAAWDMLCKPKHKGGVGIINFQKQNEALLMKHLDNFFNHVDVPWVNLIWQAYYEGSVPQAEKLCGSFWWKDICKLLDKFRAISTVLPGRGDTFLFWSDSWMFDGSVQPIAQRFPRLHSYVKEPNLTAKQVYDCPVFAELFHLPLSAQAYEEFQQVAQVMASSPLSVAADVWQYSWGTTFTASKYYQHLFAEVTVIPVFKWIWKSSCIMKHKFFAWLLLNDRLNTRDLLQRRHWKVTEDTHCVLCPGRKYEDRIHLFFECNYSQRVWNYLQIYWPSGQEVQTIFSSAKIGFGKPFFYGGSHLSMLEHMEAKE
jgi:hypothetical protein